MRAEACLKKEADLFGGKLNQISLSSSRHKRLLYSLRVMVVTCARVWFEFIVQ